MHSNELRSNPLVSEHRNKKKYYTLYARIPNIWQTGWVFVLCSVECKNENTSCLQRNATWAHTHTHTSRIERTNANVILFFIDLTMTMFECCVNLFICLFLLVCNVFVFHSLPFAFNVRYSHLLCAAHFVPYVCFHIWRSISTPGINKWLCRVGAEKETDFKRISAEKHKRATFSKCHQLKWGRRENQHENVYLSNKYK